jgi:hypothetical protein
MKTNEKKKLHLGAKSGSVILQKIIADRKIIKEHLINGGKLSELKEKGICFATIQN